MRFKLDENLGRRWVPVFREAGHDAATVLEEGLSGAPDRKVAAVAADEERALVTLDLGFANPFAFPPQDFAGIVVLRLPGRATPEDLAGCVGTLIRAVERYPVVGKLWVVQRGNVREHEARGEGPAREA